MAANAGAAGSMLEAAGPPPVNLGAAGSAFAGLGGGGPEPVDFEGFTRGVGGGFGGAG